MNARFSPVFRRLSFSIWNSVLVHFCCCWRTGFAWILARLRRALAFVLRRFLVLFLTAVGLTSARQVTLTFPQHLRGKSFTCRMFACRTADKDRKGRKPRRRGRKAQPPPFAGIPERRGSARRPFPADRGGVEQAPRVRQPGGVPPAGSRGRCGPSVRSPRLAIPQRTPRLGLAAHGAKAA